MKRKALLLDRDGVINEDHGYIGSADRFAFKTGIFDLLSSAQAKGYLLVVVTNQSGVARGYYSRDDYDRVTSAMIDGLAAKGIKLDLVLASFEHPEGQIGPLARASYWRKPNPGMILEAAMKLDIDLMRSIMIGDKDSDMQAALGAGVGKRVLLSNSPADHNDENVLCLQRPDQALNLLS